MNMHEETCMCEICKEINYILASRILQRKHKILSAVKLYTSEFNSGYNVKVNHKPKLFWSSKKKLWIQLATRNPSELVLNLFSSEPGGEKDLSYIMEFSLDSYKTRLQYFLENETLTGCL